jgi:hypothetical protein
MRSVAAAVLMFSGQVLAHPGHGAAEGHFHGWGAEHVLLLAVVLAALAFALREK